jgi:hypothetical protein
MKTYRRCLWVSVFLVLLLPGTSSTIFAAWEVGTLVSTGNVGRFCDAGVDGSGDIHAVYFRYDTDEVYAISRITGVWQMPQVVDPDGGSDGHCSVAATGAGVLRFAWRRSSTNSLMYAGPEAVDEWTYGDVIADAGNVGGMFSLYQSPAGTLSVATRIGGTESLVFAKRDGSGAWMAPETVDPGPNRGQYCDHTWRAGGGYAFSEYDESATLLLYADPVLRSDDWEIGDVAAGEDNLGQYLSLLLRDNGEMSASYYNQTDGSLLLSVRDGLGGWAAPDTVDQGPGRGSHSSHTWRPGAGYAFAELDAAIDMLLYADPVLHAGNWQTGIVRSSGHAGQHVSATVMPDGHVAATWYHYDNASRGSVYVAYNVGTADFWVIRSVADSVANSGSSVVHPDLAIVSQWRGYVAFRNDLDDYLYCATNDSVVVGVGDDIPPGVVVPNAFALYPNVPNPFNPTTTVSFGTTQTARVELRIYDVGGRLVKTLVDDVQLAGHHEVAWDGRDDRGSEVASGVYFVRLVSAGQVRTHKIVLIK